MRPPERGEILFLGVVVWASLVAAPSLARQKGQEGPPKSERPPLEMSKAVACKRIEGYERFLPLPDASLTSEDKLQVYYRPLNFKVDPLAKSRPGHHYQAKFSQDCRIRKKGEKPVLMKKDRLLEYEATFETPSERLYLMNTIGLKGLPPGDYELDIILHDELDDGVTATQSLPFTIVPSPKIDPPLKVEGPDEPEGSTSPTHRLKPSRTSKRRP